MFANQRTEQKQNRIQATEHWGARFNFIAVPAMHSYNFCKLRFMFLHIAWASKSDTTFFTVLCIFEFNSPPFAPKDNKTVKLFILNWAHDWGVHFNFTDVSQNKVFLNLTLHPSHLKEIKYLQKQTLHYTIEIGPRWASKLPKHSNFPPPQ